MAEYQDLGQWAQATLKATAAVTDLLVGGAAAVLESGELLSSQIDAWAKERLDNPALAGRALALVVVDTGERPTDKGRVTSCSVFAYDRGSSSPYSILRNVREAVLLALLDQPVLLVRDAQVVSTKHEGRTGHETAPEFDLDFERIDIYGPILAFEADMYG